MPLRCLKPPPSGGMLPFVHRLPAVACFFIACFLTLFGCPPVGATPKDPAAADTVPCSHCDAQGRQTCPGCNGKGQIFKVCTRCNGNGRRPCTQCNNPRRNNPRRAGEKQQSPGAINCSRCSGSGTEGQRPPRTCSKCRGSGQLDCPTCVQKGTLKCKKELFAGICPRCRFSGKITCEICSGARVVLAKDLTTKKLSGTRSTAVGPTMVKQKKVATKADRRVEERFRHLLQLHEQYTAQFAEEMSAKLYQIRRDAEALLRTLRGDENDERREATVTLTRLHRQTNQLRWRWEDEFTAFKGFDRAFLDCEKFWSKSSERQPGDENGSKQWEEDMRLVLRICEKRADRLEKADPATLVREILALEESWEETEPEVRALLAANGPRGKKAAPTPDTERVRKTTQASDLVRVDAASAPKKPRVTPTEEPRSKDLTPTAETFVVKPPTSVDHHQDASFLAGVLWGMGGFLLLAVGGHFFLRWRSGRTLYARE